MDIGQLKNNVKYYKNYEGEPEIIFQIKEKPEINIHIWDGYIDALFYNIEPYEWKSFTKDYEEATGPWDFNSDFCVVNVDEYYNDIKSYLNKDYPDYPEEKEVLQMILLLFEYAKENNFNVQIQVD